MAVLLVCNHYMMCCDIISMSNSHCGGGVTKKTISLKAGGLFLSECTRYD